MKFSSTDCQAEAQADRVFDMLSAYSRCRIATEGTAFTTYEDLGDDVCACLERRCRAWVCSAFDDTGARKADSWAPEDKCALVISAYQGREPIRHKGTVLAVREDGLVHAQFGEARGWYDPALLERAQ